MMRQIVLFAAAAALLAAGARAPRAASPSVAGLAREQPGLNMQQAAGRAVFTGKGNCATCHRTDATGTPLGPDLTDGEWLNISGTLEEITEVVRVGIARPKKYPAPMPPMGGARLRPAEIDAVARYVLSLNPTAAPEGAQR
jgi:cbb3-type cytochrome c oxidase subunit III